MAPHAPSALALALAAALGLGCHVSLSRSQNLVVDGVELEARHDETLRIEAWSPAGLAVESPTGDVRVLATDGPNRITVTLHEIVQGDARAVYEDGRLLARTRSGEPCAVGEVTVLVASPLPSLTVETGMGDVELGRAPVEGPVRLATGMGDVSVRGGDGLESLHVCTGMGDVDVEGAAYRAFHASTGMGDVRAVGVHADEGRCSSGMGDVDLADSSFVRLEASTGMGDVHCERTSYEEGELDSGLGSVHR